MDKVFCYVDTLGNENIDVDNFDIESKCFMLKTRRYNLQYLYDQLRIAEICARRHYRFNTDYDIEENGNNWVVYLFSENKSHIKTFIVCVDEQVSFSAMVRAS